MGRMNRMGARSGIAALFLGAALAGSLTTPSIAQEVFTIQGGAVQNWGGDIVQAWADEHNLKVEYIAGSVDPHHTRLFQEASLPESSIDMSILLSRFLNENIATLFEPLDGYNATAPIDDIEGISPGMRSAMTVDGKIYGIPWRQATEALHMNMALLKEQGITEPPKTFEEVLEYAEKLTYKRADGTQVHGLIFEGPTVASLAQYFRNFGAEFMTTDMQVKTDSPEMIAAMDHLHKMYETGILPTGFLNFIPGEDSTAMMQQGRAAMIFSPFGRTFQYSNREASKFPDDFVTIAVPPRAGHVAPSAKTEFWSYVILANSKKKELAWDLIRRLSTLESTVRMAAEKANGPVREAAFLDPRVQKALPYAASEATEVATATPPLPGFSRSAQAADYFTEAVQSVLIGAASPTDAMTDLAEKTRALLK